MGKAMEVVAADEDSVLVRSGEQLKELPLSKAKYFSVFDRDKIEIGQPQQRENWTPPAPPRAVVAIHIAATAPALRDTVAPRPPPPERRPPRRRVGDWV